MKGIFNTLLAIEILAVSGFPLEVNSKPVRLRNNALFGPLPLIEWEKTALTETSTAQPNLQWITVTIHPRANEASLLEFFSQYGEILEIKTCRAENWLRIRYESEENSQKALTGTWATFGGEIGPILSVTSTSGGEDEQQSSSLEECKTMEKTSPIQKISSAII